MKKPHLAQTRASFHGDRDKSSSLNYVDNVLQRIFFVTLCLGGEIGMLRPHHKDTKAQRRDEIVASCLPI